MSPENLNQTYFECWDFTMHVNASQVELNLEAHINVCSVYSW